MGGGRIAKDVLYGELATGHCPAGRPSLPFKDVCKHDLKLADVDPGSWEQIADDHSAWRSAVRKEVRTGEDWRGQAKQADGGQDTTQEGESRVPGLQPTLHLPLHHLVTEIVTRGLDLSATPDAAPKKIYDQTHGAFHYLIK